jgi:hypothetical protein
LPPPPPLLLEQARRTTPASEAAAFALVDFIIDPESATTTFRALPVAPLLPPAAHRRVTAAG